MIRAMYEKLTGRPWTTTRSMSAEYGPPPGAVYVHQLARYTDAELIVNGDRILAALRNRNYQRLVPAGRLRGTGDDPMSFPVTPTHHLMSDHLLGLP